MRVLSGHSLPSLTASCNLREMRVLHPTLPPLDDGRIWRKLMVSQKTVLHALKRSRDASVYQMVGSTESRGCIFPIPKRIMRNECKRLLYDSFQLISRSLLLHRVDKCPCWGNFVEFQTLSFASKRVIKIRCSE